MSFIYIMPPLPKLSQLPALVCEGLPILAKKIGNAVLCPFKALASWFSNNYEASLYLHHICIDGEERSSSQETTTNLEKATFILPLPKKTTTSFVSVENASNEDDESASVTGSEPSTLDENDSSEDDESTIGKGSEPINFDENDNSEDIDPIISDSNDLVTPKGRYDFVHYGNYVTTARGAILPTTIGHEGDVCSTLLRVQKERHASFLQKTKMERALGEKRARDRFPQQQNKLSEAAQKDALRNIILASPVLDESITKLKNAVRTQIFLPMLGKPIFDESTCIDCCDVETDAYTDPLPDYTPLILPDPFDEEAVTNSPSSNTIIIVADDDKTTPTDVSKGSFEQPDDFDLDLYHAHIEIDSDE